MTAADGRGRLKACMDCGKDTRSPTSLCGDCATYIPVDPLEILVKALQPKHHVPFPPEMVGKRVPCESNPDLFFTDRDGDDGMQDREAAKYLCQTCPLVMQEWCAEFAIQNRQKGIWGGTTEKQRREIRRSRKEMEKAA